MCKFCADINHAICVRLFVVYTKSGMYIWPLFDGSVVYNSKNVATSSSLLTVRSGIENGSPPTSNCAVLQYSRS